MIRRVKEDSKKSISPCEDTNLGGQKLTPKIKKKSRIVSLASSRCSHLKIKRFFCSWDGKRTNRLKVLNLKIKNFFYINLCIRTRIRIETNVAPQSCHEVTFLSNMPHELRVRMHVSGQDRPVIKSPRGPGLTPTVPRLAHNDDPGSAPGHLLNIHRLQLGDEPVRPLAHAATIRH